MYDEIDVLLDTFPWNGHTTACEVLWQGVPVVALRGGLHAGRMVASVLSCLRLHELIGDTVDEYRRTAVRLANHDASLGGLRSRLRSRIASSFLCDGPKFTTVVETALRDMWTRSRRRGHS